MDGTLWYRLGQLYFFQLCEIHAEAFFTMFALELDFDELGVLFHFAFKDNALAELVVTNPFTWLILLALWYGWHRRSRRCYIAVALL